MRETTPDQLDDHQIIHIPPGPPIVFDDNGYLVEIGLNHLSSSVDAHDSGDHELGKRLSSYGFEVLDEVEAREAAAALDTAWRQLQELLVAGPEVRGVEVLRRDHFASVDSLEDDQSGVRIRAVRKLFTYGQELPRSAKTQQDQHRTTICMPMAGGLEYHEIIDKTPGKCALIAVVARIN